MKDDFIPKRDGDLDAHEANFNNKLSLHAATLGLNPNEATEIQAIIADHRNSFAIMNSKRAESKFANEDNRVKKEKALAELRRAARMIKSSRTYTPAIGEDLGIIGPDKLPKPSFELKPELKARMDGQEVIIQFRKEDSDGIKIYSRRGAESEFTFLAVDTESPYNDNRAKLDPAKPEQREYYAYFFDNDIEIGQQSDVIKIAVP